MTKPLQNPAISKHVISNSGHSFYALRSNTEIEIVNEDGSAPKPGWKYAYLESIRRDTTEGESRLWNFDTKSDYSMPFVSVTVEPKIETVSNTPVTPPVKKETPEEMSIRILKEKPELLPPRRFVMPSGKPMIPKTMHANGIANFLWISTQAKL